MKLWVTTGAVIATVALCGSAQAAARHCEPGNYPLRCAKTFIATEEPKTFVALPRGWRQYASVFGAYGRTFIAFGPIRCRDYGRLGDVRVKEIKCDGRVVVTVRSVGEPTPVTFYWDRYR